MIKIKKANNQNNYYSVSMSFQMIFKYRDKIDNVQFRSSAVIGWRAENKRLSRDTEK